jgi:tetratricopeptide (TPR) repeat protein
MPENFCTGGSKMKKINAILLALVLAVACANNTVWGAEGQGEGADKIVVGVMPFGTDVKETKDDKSAEITEAREKIAREAVIQFLAKSRAIAVLEADVIDNAVEAVGADPSKEAGVREAVEAGRHAGAQYMILGKVMKISQRNIVGKDVGFLSTSYTTSVTASAQLNMEIIDVNIGKVLMRLPGYGIGRTEISSKAVGGLLIVGGLLEAVQDLSADSKQDEQAKLEAISDASADLANKIKGELAGEYIYIRAIKGKDNIEIDADSTVGMDKKDLYLIYLDGAEKRDKDGVLTESERTPLAVVTVTGIHKGYSVAKIVPSGGDVKLIRKGDKISPISRAGARELSAGKKFAKDRPKETKSSGAYGTLFDKDSVPASLSPLVSPVNAAETPTEARSLPAPASTASSRPPENKSTDPAKVVATYSLPSGEANTRRIAHLNANTLKGQKAYDKYVELANSYDGDYLAAYQAGRLAQQLKKNDDAKTWYDKALAINPDYEPALSARKKMK